MKNNLWPCALRITYASVIGALMTSCSLMPLSQITPPDGSSLSHYNDRLIALVQLQQWHVEGKIAVYMDKRNNISNLTWRQRHNHFDLLITGPLSQGYLHIKGRPGWVVATTSEEQIQTTSIEDLFADHFEWTLPMRELCYWVRGVASPVSDAKLTLSDNGKLASLEQAGWQINYGRYTQVSGFLLPNKITIKGNHIKLKLVLKNWTDLHPLPRSNSGANDNQKKREKALDSKAPVLTLSPLSGKILPSI